MKLFKRTLAASAALLCLLSFGGCAEKSGPQSVVATVDGDAIYRWEVDYQYNKNLSYYQGYSEINLEDPETRHMLKNSILQMLIQDSAMNLYAEEQGYGLTAEEKAAVDAEYAELRATTIDKYAALYCDGDMAAAEEYYIKNLTDQHVSEQIIIDNMYTQKMRIKMSDDMYAQVEGSEEAVMEYYNAEVESDKVTYSADLNAYENDNAFDAYAVMYHPENYSRIKQILIAMPAETTAAMLSTMEKLAQVQNELSIMRMQKGENDNSVIRLGEEAEALRAEFDALKAEGHAAILDRANECLTRLNNGEDFTDLLREYGEDEAMKTAPYAELGYLMCEKSTAYDANILAAAMSLENIGDYTHELVATDYGYHILLLADKIPQGPRELDEELYTWIDERVVQYADRSEIYNATIEKAMEGRDIVTYADLLE